MERKIKLFLDVLIVASLVMQLNYEELSQEVRALSPRPQLSERTVDSSIVRLETRLLLPKINAQSVRLITHYKRGKHYFCDRYPLIETIVFVLSHVNATNQRNAIRQSWAKCVYHGQPVSLLFVLGSTADPSVQRRVDEEDSRFDDILQLTFSESSDRTGLLKAIAILRWTHFMCPKAKFIIQVNDQVMVDLENLYRFTRLHWRDRLKIFGPLTNTSESVPQPLSRFIKSPHLMTSDCIRLLYDKHLKTLAAERVLNTGIERVDEKSFLTIDRPTKHVTRNLSGSDPCIGPEL